MATIEQLYQCYSRRVQATLIRLLGDFSLAEEASQEAFAAALQQWPATGEPDNPLAWLIRTGYRRGIDQLRRHGTARRNAHLIATSDAMTEAMVEPDERSIEDDQLRLLFTCCHPSLTMEARVALTLREMCGLTTEQVASALLTKPATLAQRIVRAKRKIRDAGIPYEVPERTQLPQRLPSVLQVIYLVFNEGYSRSDGEQVIDVNLIDEAIRLGRALADLLPHGEVFGLLALMLLHDARRDTRQTVSGELMTLEEQDRKRWDAERIRTGLAWLERALPLTPVSAYTLQASIAAVHAQAPSAETTDWARIVRLYEALYLQQPTPILALNRAVAVAIRDSPQAGLMLLDALSEHPQMHHYHLYHAAKAELYRRSGDRLAAVQAYQQALALASQYPERQFLTRRLAELNLPA
ncbi:RNA polymerase sigma factor [Vreelandella neptunia]|uniref:RNA polymerase sigma factor n=1 Tax=Vreelandella neptunia TaxID=115551 RepID=A0ABS9S9X0_9GAMM|nr:RNA polymerase sigma factor [Halomonas neptunia]MCH4812884.1 RNA polymerase sigma factor [Halomonas neptunia]